ncbi:MAG: OmpA family protein [Pseudomonadota bacterium]
MKLPVTTLALAVALGAPSAVLASQIDPEREAQLLCDLAEICDDVANSERDREGAVQDGVETRSIMGVDAVNNAARPATRPASSRATTRRPTRANVTRRATSNRGVRGSGRGVTAPAVEVTDEMKEKIAGRSQLFVTFGLNSADLTPAAKSEISTLVSVMNKAEEAGKVMRLRIEGHTDATGSDSYNLSLSDKRAASVRAALIEAGVNPEQLESSGYGSTKPLDGTKPTDGANRRVEAVVID